MKLKKGLIIEKINDFYAVVPTNRKHIDFKGMMTINETGKLLFDALQEDLMIDDLVQLVMKHFEVSEAVAKNDVTTFVNKLSDYKLLER